CLTGGYGRLNVPLIQKALDNNFSIQIAPDTTLTSLHDEIFQKWIMANTDFAKNTIKVSEAEIIQQILLQMIDQNSSISATERAALRDNFLKKLTLEKSSTNTFENFFYLRELVNLSGDSIIVQTPLQELRAWATARRVFAAEIQQKNINLWRFTTPLSIRTAEKTWLINTVIAEMWRLIIYTGKGDLLLEFADATIIPSFYWESVRYLFTHAGEQEKIRAQLQNLARAAGFSDKAILYQRLGDNISTGISEFIEWVFQARDDGGIKHPPSERQPAITPRADSVRAAESIRTSL
ncbi:MAG: YdcF family protein, partial [Candidatus Omnitrophica bacterium]|nr:YdcF family protein [Candidatus Omnitrophota bacterium]